MKNKTLKQLTKAADQYFRKELIKKCRSVNLICVFPNAPMDRIYQHIKEELKRKSKNNLRSKERE